MEVERESKEKMRGKGYKRGGVERGGEGREGEERI